MEKLYLKDMETEKRNEILKENSKLMDQLLQNCYEMEMENQYEEGQLMFGKNYHKYIEIHDSYSSFYLTLTNWNQFIDNLDTDYFSPNGQIELYNEIIKKKEKLYNIEDQCSDEFYDLENEIEEQCKELLKLCENQLHEYENYPSYDDAIEYADCIDYFNDYDYYIEIKEDGSSDNIIKLDITYTETFKEVK